MGRIRDHLAYANVVSLVALLVFALACCLAIGGGQASAGQLSCGDTITADTTLHQSLINCPNNGIVIGANGVTLNLNGHRIDGDGTPAAGCDPETEFCDVGVVNDGHDGVTMRHGSVREFVYGVFVGRARHNRVLGISASKNLFFGFFVAGAARSLVRNSSGSGNVPPEGDGMGLFSSHHVRILHNSFRHNAQLGIHVAFDSTHNLIRRNLFSRNETGIGMEADRNKVKRNRMSRNGNGIGIIGNRNVIRANRIDSSRGVELGFAIPLEHGDHNLIARNWIRDTGASAISVGFGPGEDNVVRRNHVRGAGEAGVLVGPRGKHTVLRHNVVRGAAEDGVHVTHKARHTLLRHNRARHARDDGFDVRGHATKLTGNRAARNAELGIEAGRGVIDGGGNIARHNGDPRQCTNIVCG